MSANEYSREYILWMHVLVLQKKVNINAIDNDGNTALAHAVDAGHVRYLTIALLLIEQSVYLLIADFQMWSHTLHSCSIFLVQHGAKLDINVYSTTPSYTDTKTKSNRLIPKSLKPKEEGSQTTCSLFEV